MKALCLEFELQDDNSLMQMISFEGLKANTEYQDELFYLIQNILAKNEKLVQIEV